MKAKPPIKSLSKLIRVLKEADTPVPDYAIRRIDAGATFIKFPYVRKIAHALELPSTATILGLSHSPPLPTWKLPEKPIGVIAKERKTSIRGIALELEIHYSTLYKLNHGSLTGCDATILNKLLNYGIHIDDLLRYRPKE